MRPIALKVKPVGRHAAPEPDGCRARRRDRRGTAARREARRGEHGNGDRLQPGDGGSRVAGGASVALGYRQRRERRDRRRPRLPGQRHRRLLRHRCAIGKGAVPLQREAGLVAEPRRRGGRLRRKTRASARTSDPAFERARSRSRRMAGSMSPLSKSTVSWRSACREAQSSRSLRRRGHRGGPRRHLRRRTAFASSGCPSSGIEGASGFGGVWYHNGYPGSRVDTDSVDYCYHVLEGDLRGLAVERALRGAAGAARLPELGGRPVGRRERCSASTPGCASRAGRATTSAGTS